MDVVGEIKRVKVWHHRIDLGEGLLTPGLQDTQSVLKQINLPQNLTGKRVLDLGTRDGFFAFECEKRGASEVVAIDYVNQDETGFALCARVLNSKVKFYNMNAYEISPELLGTFDIVLFLGLIYHLRHPVLALDRIYDITNSNGSLFIESHTIDHGLVSDDGEWADLDPALEKLQIAQYFSGGALGNDPTSVWAPNLACLENMAHDAGFKPTYSWTVGFRGGLIAQKIPLSKDHPRFIDTAHKFDMHTSFQVVEQSQI